MRVLLDHCVPHPLAPLLVGHDVATTDEMGWEDESNGRLLVLAASRFDVFLSVDKGLAHQQNLAALPLPVIILRCRSNSIASVQVHVPSLLGLLAGAIERRVYILEPDR